MLVLKACGGRAAYLRVVVCFCIRLSCCLRDELGGNLGFIAATKPRLVQGSSNNSSSSSGTSGGCLSPAVQQLLQSPLLLQLLAASQALYVQVLQDMASSTPSRVSHQAGSSSSRVSAAAGSSSAAAAAAAEDVLQALGIGWSRIPSGLLSHVTAGNAALSIAEALGDTAVVAQYMLDSSDGMHMAGGSSGGNVAEAVASSSPQQQQVNALLQPWALLQLDSMQLLGNLQLIMPCVQALQVLVTRAATTLAAPAYAALKSLLLQPVLLLLLREHLQEVPAGSVTGSSSSSSSRRVVGFSELDATASEVLIRLLDDGEHGRSLVCYVIRFLHCNGFDAVLLPPPLMPLSLNRWCNMQ
jgi:hypothetical protein